MSFSWPEYTSEQLGGERSWSAKFDSYDERHDDAYYLVTVSDGDQVVATFMAQVSAAFPNDDWVDPETTNQLRARIAQVAATGKTNTTYRGPVMRL